MGQSNSVLLREVAAFQSRSNFKLRTYLVHASRAYVYGSPYIVCLCYLAVFVMLQIYRNGIRNMNLKFIVTKVAIPVILYLSLALVVPYVFVHGIVPQFMYFGEWVC